MTFREVDTDPSSTVQSPSPEELLQRAWTLYDEIDVAQGVDSEHLRRVLWTAYQAVQFEQQESRRDGRGERPEFFAVLGDAYTLTPDRPSALRCWLRGAALGDATCFARLAAHHDTPARTLYYAQQYRQREEHELAPDSVDRLSYARQYRLRSKEHPDAVAANLLRMMQTAEVTEEGRVLYHEARIWHEALLWPIAAEGYKNLLQYAIAAEMFNEAEAQIEYMTQQGEDVTTYRTFLDHQREVHTLFKELRLVVQQAGVNPAAYPALERRALAMWNTHREPEFGAVYLFALGAQRRLPAPQTEQTREIPALQDVDYQNLVDGIRLARAGQTESARRLWEEVSTAGRRYWKELASYYLTLPEGWN